MANHVSPPRGVWSAQPALQNQENPPQDAPAEGSIQESGSVVTNDGHSSIHCLTIIGQIEGHYILPSQNKTTKYEHVIPPVGIHRTGSGNRRIAHPAQHRRRGCGSRPGPGRTGGRYDETDSIRGAGGGHSIGVPLAVAARRSFIVPTATMTIHPVRMNGLLLGVPQTFEYFQRMQHRITQFVTQHSGISASGSTIWR